MVLSEMSYWFVHQVLVMWYLEGGQVCQASSTSQGGQVVLLREEGGDLDMWCLVERRIRGFSLYFKKE